MKIALASDLHLEFGDVDFENTENADVLVLSGDICVAQHFKGKYKYSQRYLDFFKRVTDRFPQVIYVLGNHEHYSGDLAETYFLFKAHLKFANLHILENETVDIDGVTFIGTTLWTDMNQEDSLTLQYMPNAMNDFREVRNSNRMVHRKVPLYLKDLNTDQYVKDDKGYLIPNGFKEKIEPGRFSPEDSVLEHKKALDYINAVVSERADQKFVVCTHHCPSESSVHPKYRHESIMNGAFRSKLDDFIAYRPQIKLWTHGHTHEQFDYHISSTRVVCNPRGYIGYEPQADSFQVKYIDL